MLLNKLIVMMFKFLNSIQ